MATPGRPLASFCSGLGRPHWALLQGCCGCKIRPKDGPAVSQACGDQRWLRPRAGEGLHAGGEPASQGRHSLPFGARPGPFVHGHGESFQ